MSKFEIRIEELAPMRVASFKGFSETPEAIASDAAIAWAKQKGLIESFHTFGFNNPSPWATEGPEYGYEVWVVIGEDVEVEKDIEVKKFPGHLCAVTSIEKLADIGNAWEYLYKWVKKSEEYDPAKIDGLEEVTSPLGTPEEDLSFNLYLPVKK